MRKAHSRNDGEFFHSRGQAAIVLLCGFALVAIGIAAITSIATSRESDESLINLVGFCVFLALLTFLPAVLVFRAARSGVRIEGKNVRLQMILKDRVIPVSEIQEFRLGISKDFGAAGICTVRLYSGEEISVIGISAPQIQLFDSSRSASELVHRLNLLLGERG